MNVLSLCSGIGGLDLGIRLACPTARTICFVEREAYSAAVLVARMQDGSLDPAPIWSDLSTFDGRAWRGVVDLVAAGYPCQPFSTAGRRGGTDDPRHLWPHVARIVRECGAGLVLLENVPGHLSLGFQSVCEELDGMGYRIAAGVFSASEVGAPHRRERLFALAHREQREEHGIGRLGELGRDAVGRGEQAPLGNHGQAGAERAGGYGGEDVAHRDMPRGGDAEPVRKRRSSAEPRGDGEDVARRDPLAHGDGDGFWLRGLTAQRHQGQPQPESAERGGSVGDPGGTGPQGRERAGAPDQRDGAPAHGPTAEPGGARMEHAERPRRAATGQRCGQHAGAEPEARSRGAWPPGPNADWSGVPGHLWPATAQSGVRGMAHGAAARVDRLRALGNGVVPQVAARAFATLWAELVRDQQSSRLAVGESRCADHTRTLPRTEPAQATAPSTKWLITLRDTVTGFTRTIEDDDPQDNDEAYTYWWTNGNMECDCNRSMRLYDLKIDDEGVYDCNSGDNRIVLVEMVKCH